MRRAICISAAVAVSLITGSVPDWLQPIGQLAAPALVIALWFLVDGATTGRRKEVPND
jgi:hypothetical protein